MYRIVKLDKKKINWGAYDFQFSNLEDFYGTADNLTKPLVGRFKVALSLHDYADVKSFKSVVEKYDLIDIDVICPAELINNIALRDLAAPIADTKSMFTVFQEIIASNELVIEKDAFSLLYNSIGHSIEELNEAAMQVKMEYPDIGLTITTKMLSELFILNKSVYPRSVVIEFISMKRWRWSKLQRAIDEYGNDLVVGAVIKNIKKFLQSKIRYYKTGEVDGIVRLLDANNLLWMYQVFITDRSGINDATLLFHLYERGISKDDIIQKEAY